MQTFSCSSISIFLAVAGATVAQSVAWADGYPLQVGTIGNEPAWMVTLDGVAWYTPFLAIVPPGVSAIGLQQELKGLTSTGDPEPAVGGLDLIDWNGMWAAKYNFYIPSWAGDIHFHLNAANVDDKAAIFVDSFPVGFFALNDKTGPGTFQFADDPNNVYDVNYVSSQNFPSWGWDKELRTGWNSIEVYLDNTDDRNQDLSAPAATDIYGSKLYTYLSLDATVTYVPEPGTWILLLSIAGVLAAERGFQRFLN